MHIEIIETFLFILNIFLYKTDAWICFEIIWTIPNSGRWNSRASRLVKHRRVQDSSAGSEVSLISSYSTSAHIVERFRVEILALQLLSLWTTLCQHYPSFGEYCERVRRNQAIRDREVAFEENFIKLVYRNYLARTSHRTISRYWRTEI